MDEGCAGVQQNLNNKKLLPGTLLLAGLEPVYGWPGEA
jgi:hypothetical protein